MIAVLAGAVMTVPSQVSAQDEDLQPCHPTISRDTRISKSTPTLHKPMMVEGLRLFNPLDEDGQPVLGDQHASGCHSGR